MTGLVSELVDLSMRVSLVQVRMVDVAAGLLERQGGIVGSVPAYMALVAGLSGAEAKQLCRVAKRLPGLPAIGAAFRGGRLSLDTVDVLLKVATAENEEVVMVAAGSATGAQLRKIVKTFRWVRDAEAPEPQRHEEVGYGCDEALWSLTARLRPARGAEVEAALRAAREDVYRAMAPQAPDGADGVVAGKRPPVSNADAFVHMARAYLESRLTASGVLPERFMTIVHIDLTDARTARTARPADHAERADQADRAGHEPADRDPANVEGPKIREDRDGRDPGECRDSRWGHGERDSGDGADGREDHDSPGPGIRENRRGRGERCDRGERVRGDVADGHEDHDGHGAPAPTFRESRERVSLADLVAGRSFDPTNRDDVAWLRGIGALDGPTLGQLLCESRVSIVASRGGIPVNVTVPQRLATPAQRRALHAMHPTCQYPGCGRGDYLQAHHVHFARNKGPTALWNLALTCDEHHDQLHQPGWAAALTDDHTLLVWRPDNTLVNNPALRPERPDTAAQFAKTAADTPVDRNQRMHGTGEHLTSFGLDVYLHGWLENTTAA